jgi:putative transposase
VKKSSQGVGIDVGLRTFATLSDGNVVEHPRFLKQSLEQLKSVQQELSRKKRGSKNRAKAKLTVARVHEKISNRRRDFVHQTVATLVREYDGFALEKLDVRAMTSTDREVDGLNKKQSRGLRRGIMDSGWSLFGAHLVSKAEEAGMPVVHVDPRGTSQRCSACGTVVRKTLRNRVHECFACGLVLDRDENAARNIYDLGCRSASGGSAARGCAESAEVLMRTIPISHIQMPGGIDTSKAFS